MISVNFDRVSTHMGPVVSTGPDFFFCAPKFSRWLGIKAIIRAYIDSVSNAGGKFMKEGEIHHG